MVGRRGRRRRNAARSLLRRPRRRVLAAWRGARAGAARGTPRRAARPTGSRRAQHRRRAHRRGRAAAARHGSTPAGWSGSRRAVSGGHKPVAWQGRPSRSAARAPLVTWVSAQAGALAALAPKGACLACGDKWIRRQPLPRRASGARGRGRRADVAFAARGGAGCGQRAAVPGSCAAQVREARKAAPALRVAGWGSSTVAQRQAWRPGGDARIHRLEQQLSRGAGSFHCRVLATARPRWDANGRVPVCCRGRAHPRLARGVARAVQQVGRSFAACANGVVGAGREKAGAAVEPAASQAQRRPVSLRACTGCSRLVGGAEEEEEKKRAFNLSRSAKSAKLQARCLTCAETTCTGAAGKCRLAPWRPGTQPCSPCAPSLPAQPPGSLPASLFFDGPGPTDQAC